MPKITLPAKFICPLSKEVMVDPVILEDGITYERSAIESWLTINNTSPTYKQHELTDKKFITNTVLKKEIENYLLKNQICTLKEFLTAVKVGDIIALHKLNFLEEYINHHIVDFNCLTEVLEVIDRGSPLSYAVNSQNINLTNYLLSQGADPNDYSREDGWTVLQSATEKGNIALVKLLLEKGADTAKVDFGRDETLPIDIARQKKLSEIEKLLKHYHYLRHIKNNNESTRFFNKESVSEAKQVQQESINFTYKK